MDPVSLHSVRNIPAMVSAPTNRSARERITNTLASPIHSRETVQRYNNGNLSTLHSIFVGLTETPLKTIGSLFVGIAAIITPLKLFNDSDGSIFKSWRFLGALGLAAGAAFGSNSYLSPPIESPKPLDNNQADDTISETPSIGIEKRENSTKLQQDLISKFREKVLKFFDDEFGLDELNENESTLLNSGIEKCGVRDSLAKTKSEFIQTFHKNPFNSSSICETFTENNQKKVMGVRVDLNEMQEAFKGRIHQLQIQFIIKGYDEEDKEFKPSPDKLIIPTSEFVRPIQRDSPLIAA